MIEVLKAGFYDSIQDLGRWEGIPYGIPIAGVMDQYAARLANFQLQNSEYAAVLEMTFNGPTLKFHETTYICALGASMPIMLNDTTSVELLTPTLIQQGDVLSFGRVKKGIRTYLSVVGGFQTEIVFGSRSWYPKITQQHRLKQGDVLSIAAKNLLKPNEFVSQKDDYLYTTTLKAYPGPEYEWLSEKEKKQLQNSFHVSNKNSRMAYLMEELIPNKLSSMITVPVQPGTVQLTPSGQLIVLMRDAQTTGGYPRILQLGAQAITILAQKKTGDEIQFKLVSQ